MGMTIDVTIKNGIDLIDVIKEYWPSDKAIDTVGELVEVAKKYQKIQEIINNAKDLDRYIKYNWLYEQIRKVIEDENDD